MGLPRGCPSPARPPHQGAPRPTVQLSAGLGRGTQLGPAPESEGEWGVLEGPAASEPGALSQGHSDDGTMEAGRPSCRCGLTLQSHGHTMHRHGDGPPTGPAPAWERSAGAQRQPGVSPRSTAVMSASNTELA